MEEHVRIHDTSSKYCEYYTALRVCLMDGLEIPLKFFMQCPKCVPLLKVVLEALDVSGHFHF